MSREPLLIKNVMICDQNRHELADVSISNGVIELVGKDLDKPGKLIDGNSLTLMPAFIDMHAHFRDPGYTYKEDLLTGSKAAIKGGYTTVNLMANTLPVCNDDLQVEQNISKVTEIGLIDIFQSCSITKDFNGKDCDHIQHIYSPGCKVISDDGNGVESDTVMNKAMEIAQRKGLIVSSHAEYKSVSKVDTRASENQMTQRDLTLCAKTKAHLHMAHVSTKEAIQMVADAKSKGVNVTCECTPHHLTLTNQIAYSVHPPLREQQDVESLIAAINNQTVDCIATDHAPHSFQDKLNGSVGMSSIEIAFSICFTHLVKKGMISLMTLSKLMSFNPAKLLGVHKGLIQKGYIADLVLIDPTAVFEVNPSEFLSKGKNTPFSGKILNGKIMTVIKDGVIKYDNGVFVERSNHG